MKTARNPQKEAKLMKISGFARIAVISLALAGCQKQPPQPTGPQNGTAIPNGAMIMKATSYSTSTNSLTMLKTDTARLVLPAVAGNPAAAYFTLVNDGAAPAVLKKVVITGAAKAEMHQTTGDTMEELPTVTIPAKGKVVFAPGGKHVMIFGLSPMIKAGSSTGITLTFDDGSGKDALILNTLKVEAAGAAEDKK